MHFLSCDMQWGGNPQSLCYDFHVLYHRLTNTLSLSIRPERSCTFNLNKAAAWLNQDFVHQVRLCGCVWCLAAEGWDVCRRGLHASAALQGHHPLHRVRHHGHRHSHSQRFVLYVCFFHTRAPCRLWVSEVCVFLSVGGGAGKLYDVFECDFTSQWLSQSNTLLKSEP